ncbi:MAG TPA: PAS domain-containing protein, partial [Anaerolineales bacterium]|nr:PAS domain-containing protein [Anaerolineales bacterium]
MSKVPESHLISEGEFQKIFEAAGDGLMIYDIGLDTVVEANPAACEMHGYTRPEFIGLNSAVFMLPESHTLLKEQVR